MGRKEPPKKVSRLPSPPLGPLFALAFSPYEAKGGEGKRRWQNFQEGLGKSGCRTLLQSPCSGSPRFTRAGPSGWPARLALGGQWAGAGEQPAATCSPGGRHSPAHSFKGFLGVRGVTMYADHHPRTIEPTGIWASSKSV